MKEWIKTIAYFFTIVLIVLVIGARLAQSTNMTGLSYFEVVDLSVAGDVYAGGSIGGVPEGATLLFTSSCPTGWTRITAADGRYLRFSSTAGATGGSATHTHTYSHTHSTSFTTGSGGGSHSGHDWSFSTGSVSDHTHFYTGYSEEPDADGSLGFTRVSVESGSGGTHSHTVSETSSSAGSIHTHTVYDTGSGSATIGNGNNDPPYVDFVVCKK